MLAVVRIDTASGSRAATIWLRGEPRHPTLFSHSRKILFFRGRIQIRNSELVSFPFNERLKKFVLKSIYLIRLHPNDTSEITLCGNILREEMFLRIRRLFGRSSVTHQLLRRVRSRESFHSRYYS